MMCRECGSNIEEEGYCVLCDCFGRSHIYIVEDSLLEELGVLCDTNQWKTIDGLMASAWSNIDKTPTSTIVALLTVGKKVEDNLTQVIPLYEAALNKFRASYSPQEIRGLLNGLKPCHKN